MADRRVPSNNPRNKCGAHIGSSSLLSNSGELQVRIKFVTLSKNSVCRFYPYVKFTLKYRKIPKISPGSYIFQRPFLRGLFLEGLIHGGVYLRREICVSKSIGLVLYLEVNLHFLYLRAIFQVQAPGGLIFGGAN